MRNIWIICRKELGSYFASPVAYLLLTMFGLIFGFFFWNALAFSHALGVFEPEFGSCPETRFGRLEKNPLISGADPCTEKSVESKTVNGVPLMRVAIPLSCQAPSAC